MLGGTRGPGRTSVAISVAVAFTVVSSLRLAGGTANPSDASVSDAGQAGSSRVKRKPQRRPNVIVITTDDQNDSVLGMPFTRRRFAKASTTFSNALVSYPLCCPSRATLLTGQYAHNHGVLENHGVRNPDGGFLSFTGQRNTLPVWLRRAGYRTAHIGRYLNGYGVEKPKLVPPGWTEWQTLTGTGQQRRWGYQMNVNGRVIRYGGTTKPGDYITDVLQRRTLRLISRWTPSSRPFFLWLTPTAPHAEGVPLTAPRNPRPAPRHFGAFEGVPLTLSPAFNEDDVSDKPEEIREAPPLDAETESWLARRHVSRAESMLSVDGAIRAIVRRLRKHRELRRTVIVFSSDNGVQNGEHRVLYKNHPYEESVQVPLLIRGPGFPKGKTREQVVSNVDLARTILDITGGRPRRPQDGRSLRFLARHPRAGLNRMLLFESFSSYQSRGFGGVHTRRYSYIRRPSGEEELYDLTRDPYQLESLHADPDFAGVLGSFAAALDRLRDCAGRACG